MITLLVLRTTDLAQTRAFYETVGLAFVEEQHGNGPVHYACERDGMVIELYPGKPGSAPDRRTAGATMIGFRVDHVDAVLANFRAMGAIILTEAQSSAWGQRAVVQDPDGRAIELSSPAIT